MTRAAKQAENNDEDHSSGESPSGPDTDDDSVGQNGQNGANKIPRGMKRKRPLIVSYVPCFFPNIPGSLVFFFKSIFSSLLLLLFF